MTVGQFGNFDPELINRLLQLMQSRPDIAQAVGYAGVGGGGQNVRFGSAQGQQSRGFAVPPGQARRPVAPPISRREFGSYPIQPAPAPVPQPMPIKPPPSTNPPPGNDYFNPAPGYEYLDPREVPGGFDEPSPQPYQPQPYTMPPPQPRPEPVKTIYKPPVQRDRVGPIDRYAQRF